MRIPVIVAAMLFAVAAARAQAAGDLLIRNARIVDGSGAPEFTGDVRVVDEVVAEIGILEPRDGEEIFDAGGLVLAPGFIDTHSHHDTGLLEHVQALAVISQGVTTIVVGQDGTSNSPLAYWYNQLETAPTSINVASYVGHGSVRRAVMGTDYARPATAEELERMREIVEHEMGTGALGLSTGLEYDPGIYSATDEIVALATPVAAMGGRYISHIRSEDRFFWEAIEEIIEIGTEAKLPVQISHTKLGMKAIWGQADRLIERLDRARADGVDITADVYPYVHWQSTMTVLFPERDYTDIEEARYAVTELVPPDGIILARFGARHAYVGHTLAEIAAERGTEPAETLIALIAEAQAWERETGHDGESIMARGMSEEDVDRLLAWPHANLCSDGGLGGRHPRGFGSFTKFLSRHAAGAAGLSLEAAIHKISGLAADHMGFLDRGRIRPGYRADMVLLDPETVGARATFDQPQLTSSGIERVWVNGSAVWDGESWTGARAGEVVRGPGYRP